MKQYLLSIYQPDGEPPPREILDEVMRDVGAEIHDMTSAGAWVFNGGLHPPSTAERSTACAGRHRERGRARFPATQPSGATVGFEHIAERSDPMLRSGKGIVGHVIRTGETVIAADVSRDPHYVEGRSGTRSEIAVPILSNAEVIGALNLESDRPDAFSAGDAELLEAFAVAAAISIEKAILHRQIVEKRRIEQQLETAREVQASLLPARPPVLAAYDIAGLNLPTWDIGGDYFDYFPLADGRLGLVIADLAEFGEARLARVLSEAAAGAAGEILGALLGATRAYSGRSHYDDDFTLVVVKRLARVPSQ